MTDRVDYVRGLLGEIPALWRDSDPENVARVAEGTAIGQGESRVLVNTAVMDLDRGSDLWAWCMLVVDEQADLDVLDVDAAPSSTAGVPSMCRWLSGQAEWIFGMHDFFAEDVYRIYWQYRVLAGKPAPTTYRCGDCGNRIDPQDGAAWFRCSACGRCWTLDQEVARLTAESEAVVTLGEASKRVGVARMTLWRYVERGLFAAVGRRSGRPVYDVRDVQRAVDRTTVGRGC